MTKSVEPLLPVELGSGKVKFAQGMKAGRWVFATGLMAQDFVSGIAPDVCLDHGMTLSYYYKDPDGNRVELQCDVFGDWATSAEWMSTSGAFRANPIGVFVDPERIADAAATGETYCLAHHVSVEGDERTIMIASIRYDDTFTKSDGTWRFSERRLYVDWTDTRPISS